MCPNCKVCVEFTLFVRLVSHDAQNFHWTNRLFWGCKRGHSGICDQTPTLSGWWFGTFFVFPYIGKFIIPIDEFIFFRGVGIPPTRYHFGTLFNMLFCFTQFSNPPEMGNLLVICTCQCLLAQFGHEASPIPYVKSHPQSLVFAYFEV